MPFDSLRWVVVPGQVFNVMVGDSLETVIGLYDAERNIIAVASEYRFNETVYAHEILHALGVTGHPNNPFETCRLTDDPRRPQ